MKSKYFQVFLLIGLIPILVLTGVYAWSILNAPEKPMAAAAPSGPALNPATVQTEISTLSSSLYNDLKKTHDDTTMLLQHHADTDLAAFAQSHPGVSGVLVVSLDGKTLRSIPAAPSLVDPTYGTSDEFKSVLDHLKSQPGGIYQFYTQKFSNPSFIFALDLSPTAEGEVVFDLSSLFKDINLHGGEAYILDGKSGQYLYATNPSRYGQTFNTAQIPALTKVQTDLSAQASGIAQGTNTTLIYTPFLNSYGVVEEIPQAAFTAAPAAKPEDEGTPLEQLQTPVTLAAVVALGWVFLMFYVGLGLLLGPLKKARAAILAAVQSGKSIGPETLVQFGKDEVGQIVQAASDLLRKLESEKTELERDKEEAIRQARALIENKNKEAQQIQQQADSVKKNLEDTTQQLNDKLKELDALKGMAEGLRGQTEQSKADNAKLKTQVAGLETSQGEVQKKLTAAESKIKETEAKLLQALSTASPLQVSQVRSAAIKTMAEELKTTLGIIKGYVSSALGATQGGINEKQQEFLGMVINRSARLEKFINDLLDIYQVEIEQAEAKTEEVNLPSEIEGLAFNFQAQAEVKNIKIKVEGKPNLPKVPIVRRRFNQLWNILYLQIIKDAPRGSTISISLEPLGEMVKVSVVDPGLVVKPESLPKLFDEFYDPKHPASTQLAGTGLKFALIKTILAAHGGGAVAEPSNPGTMLILTFPTKRKVPGAVPAPVAAPVSAVPLTAPVAAPVAKPTFTVPGLAPKAPGLTSGGVAPLTPRPAGIAPVAPPVGTMSPVGTVPPTGPKPGPASGVLDSLLSGNIPPAGIVSPVGTSPTGGPVVPPAKPLVAPVAPVVPPAAPVARPPVGAVPPAPAGPAPAMSSGTLDSLLSAKISSLGATPPPPAGPVVPSAPGISVPKPPVPPTVAPIAPPRPPTVPGMGISTASPVGTAPGVPAAGAPLAPKPPAPVMPPAGVAPARPPASPLGTAPPMGSVPPAGVAPRPPIPGMPPVGAAPRPPMPPTPGVPGMPPVGAVPPRPPAPVVVPTSIKPTAPPEGILDLDNLDSFKVDDGSKPPAPKSPVGTMPPAPPALDKPIVKSKEGEGEIIE